MTLKTEHIDWFNIILMAGAAVAAYALPFEVFLFSYAVLGPLHYLTEISWLQQRQFFTQTKYDYVWLLLIGIALFGVQFLVPWGTDPASIAQKQQWAAGLTYLAFISALAMVLFRGTLAKVLCILGGSLLLLGLARWPAYLLVFGVFLPTLVHVYVFTALFMLYGALKSRSTPGLFAVAALLVCPIVLVLLSTRGGYDLGQYTRDTYRLFHDLNVYILMVLGLGSRDGKEMHATVYQSATGLAIMRCIAFAYTYHYLNWFSKTSIIKWHDVSWRRLSLIAGLWLLSVGLYGYNYRVGFIALFTLSFLHVFLEFPLNHQSILGIGRELRTRWRPTPAPRRREMAQASA